VCPVSQKIVPAALEHEHKYQRQQVSAAVDYLSQQWRIQRRIHPLPPPAFFARELNLLTGYMGVRSAEAIF